MYVVWVSLEGDKESEKRFEASEVQERIFLSRYPDGELSIVGAVLVGVNFLFIMDIYDISSNDMLLACALIRDLYAKCPRVSFYVSKLPYGRNNEFSELFPGNFLTRFMSMVGIHKIYTVDAHQELPNVVNISPAGIIAEKIRSNSAGKPIILIAPDKGGVRRCEDVKSLMPDNRTLTYHTLKTRNADGSIEYKPPYLPKIDEDHIKIDNWHIAIIDDIWDTGGTIRACIAALSVHGLTTDPQIYATHYTDNDEGDPTSETMACDVVLNDSSYSYFIDKAVDLFLDPTTDLIRNRVGILCIEPKYGPIMKKKLEANKASEEYDIALTTANGMVTGMVVAYGITHIDNTILVAQHCDSIATAISALALELKKLRRA